MKFTILLSIVAFLPAVISAVDVPASLQPTVSSPAKYAANPPSKCCGMGVEHTGTPTGKISKFGGIDTYISGSASSTVLFFLTDIVGYTLINAQLLADDFARQGYKVIMPDLFSGDPWPLNPPADADLNQWLTGHGLEQTQPIIDAVLGAIKTELKPKKIATVGYCFGGKYVVRLLGDESSQVKVGFTAHPSFVTAEEMEGIKAPISIAAAENDAVFTADLRHQAEETLIKIGAEMQINLYGGVAHGFAVRGNMSVPDEKWALEQATSQAKSWLKFRLAQLS